MLQVWMLVCIGDPSLAWQYFHHPNALHCSNLPLGQQHQTFLPLYLHHGRNLPFAIPLEQNEVVDEHFCVNC